MLQTIESRMIETMNELEKSAANHNFLLGVKASLESLAKDLKEAAPVAEAIASVACPSELPVIETVVEAL